MQSTPRSPIVGLDFIRFLAAFTVLLYHFGFKAFATAGNQMLVAMGRSPALPPWWAPAWWGWVGVQIFFVISGLVIACSATGATPLRFATGRALRLMPALLICATVALIAAVTIFAVPPAHALALFAGTIMLNPFGPWIMGQFWTLPIEIMFYAVVWGLVAARRPQHLEALAWLLAALSAIYWTGTGAGYVDPSGRLTALLLLQHGCYFALGIAMAETGVTGATKRLLILQSLCIATAAAQIRAAAAGEHLPGGLAGSWIVPFAIWLLVMLLAAASLRWRGLLAEIVGRHRGAIRLLGVMTYPLYLVHIHAGGPVLVALVTRGVSPLLAIAAAIVASIAAALVIAVWLEPPLRGLLARLLGGLGGRIGAIRSRGAGRRPA